MTVELDKFSTFALAYNDEVTFASDESAAHIVTFTTDGGSEIEEKIISDGEKVIKPDDPVKDGYLFDGWYKEDTLTTKFDFTTDTITETTTLYAKWTEGMERKGNNIGAFNANGDLLTSHAVYDKETENENNYATAYSVEFDDNNYTYPSIAWRIELKESAELGVGSITKIFDAKTITPGETKFGLVISGAALLEEDAVVTATLSNAVN